MKFYRKKFNVLTHTYADKQIDYVVQVLNSDKPTDGRVYAKIQQGLYQLKDKVGTNPLIIGDEFMEEVSQMWEIYCITINNTIVKSYTACIFCDIAEVKRVCLQLNNGRYVGKFYYPVEVK